MAVSPVVPGDATIKTQAATGGSKPEPSEKDRIAAKKVAKDFEALFVGIMIKSMRDTVVNDDMTYGGHGEDVYRSLLDQEYAKAVSENHSLGLADRIEKELLKSLPVKRMDNNPGGQ
ncbi:MAG TPA: rod-binding protein [Geobacteraceae bacterium]|nr:rod-binding protein [Geobacteraceae bacterium]